MICRESCGCAKVPAAYLLLLGSRTKPEKNKEPSCAWESQGRPHLLQTMLSVCDIMS